VLAASNRQRVTVRDRSSDTPANRRDVSDTTGALDASIVAMLLTVNRQIGLKLYAPPWEDDDDESGRVSRATRSLRHRDSRGSPNALTDLWVNRKYGAFVFLDSAGRGIESLPRAP
jgi:hypothetical protein